MSLKEKGQYGLSFGVIALMLYVVGFPVFLLMFFGILGFFVWKIFSPESRTETRKIFEFYLSASEILREDDRRWYGFEIQETIARGEAVLRTMTAVPPLVHFSLGALYQKIGDHASAVKHLSDAVESPVSNELSVVFPPNELREYVRLLRRIERAPAESPLTSAAIRSLERMRKNRGMLLLESSRAEASKSDAEPLPALGEMTSNGSIVDEPGNEVTLSSPIADNVAVGVVDGGHGGQTASYRFADIAKSRRKKTGAAESGKQERKTISEVLHDIYDSNVQ